MRFWERTIRDKCDPVIKSMVDSFLDVNYIIDNNVEEEVARKDFLFKEQHAEEMIIGIIHQAYLLYDPEERNQSDLNSIDLYDILKEYVQRIRLLTNNILDRIYYGNTIYFDKHMSIPLLESVISCVNID